MLLLEFSIFLLGFGVLLLEFSVFSLLLFETSGVKGFDGQRCLALLIWVGGWGAALAPST